MKVWILALVGLLFGVELAYAHPGGLNRSGCHNVRATGGYHCHRASSNRSTPRARPNRYRSDLSPAAQTRPSRDYVRSIQIMLNDRGCNAGVPDGLAGRGTVDAVRRFQRKTNVVADGQIDDGLMLSLVTAERAGLRCE